MIQIRYFARLREAVGTSLELVEFHDGMTAGELLEQLKARGETWTRALADEPVLRVAINQEIAKWDSVIRDGDEIALFPPVTGG